MFSLLPHNFIPRKFLLIGFSFFCIHPILKAQTPEIQISLTGFNEDVIADPVLNSVPTSSTTNSVDLSTYVFYMDGYSNNGTAYTNGIPLSEQYLSSTNHSFQLAPYNANNDLRLEATQSGTLTFAAVNQRPYSVLYLAACAGDGDININYTINFSDASTESGSVFINDWFCSGCTPYGIKDLGRAQVASGTLGGTSFAIGEYPINVSVPNQAKQINSIDITVPAPQTEVANIFGITGIASTSALPVSVEYFNARSENNKVVLQWKTAQEFKNKQFIIERATAAQPSVFVTAGKVLSSSLPNGATYSFTDVSALRGTYLYRLSQQDVDGNIKILGIRSITVGNKNSWIVQDNGVNWQLISSEPLKFRLIDINGRLLRSYSGSGNVTIPKPSARGIYELQIQTGNEFFTQKLLK
jgi:hypothetical protein